MFFAQIFLRMKRGQGWTDGQKSHGTVRMRKLFRAADGCCPLLLLLGCIGYSGEFLFYVRTFFFKTENVIYLCSATAMRGWLCTTTTHFFQQFRAPGPDRTYLPFGRLHHYQTSILLLVQTGFFPRLALCLLLLPRLRPVQSTDSFHLSGRISIAARRVRLGYCCSVP